MRKTIQDLQAFKNAEKPLVCLTAYSAPMAAALDAHVDVLLVGDSMGMVLYGMDSTRGVTLDMMIAHGAAVVRGSQRACVVVDLPYGTYEDSPAQALASARRVMDEAGAQAVKLEGGAAMAPVIAALVESGIPVMGHIGLLPQSVEDGQFKIAGKDDQAAERLLDDARALEEAGAFSIVIEGTVEGVAARLTQSVSIPTVGIGASAACDGQVLVSEDMLGLGMGHVPKFVHQYAQLSEAIDAAATAYAADVRARRFPGKEQVY